MKKWGIVISPIGEEIEIITMGSFCREHGLRRDRMKSLFREERQHHRGWQLKNNSFVSNKNRTQGSRIDWKLTSPNGEIFEIRNLKKFCDEHELNYQSLKWEKHNSSHRKSAKHKDWKIERE